MMRILKIRTEICFGSRLECAPQTYSLFKEDNGGYFFRHWKMGEDGKRRSKKHCVRQQDIEPLLERLRHVVIPAFPDLELGCDGGYTELEVGDYGGKSSFRWWSAPPRGWEQMDEVVNAMLGLLPENR